MKLKLSILILITFFCFQGFSQEDPLVKQSQSFFKVRTKVEMAKNEAKLSVKGKTIFEKAKNDFANVKNAKFDIAPNEIMNREPKDLLGIPSNEKPDLKVAAQQNEENKRIQSDIKTQLQRLKIDASALDFSYAHVIPKPVLLCTWNTNILTPVKDQGQCGSCWAFAACATFEHTYAKLYGAHLDLSEQDVVACGKTCKNVDCGSCGGGWSDRAFDFMVCKGITNETTYPYNIPSSNTCYAKTKTNWAYTWGQLYPGRFPTVAEIQYYINIYGAVVTYLWADISTFYGYGGGVYNGYPSTSTNEIDHAVTIVGWCNSLNAWIIKNSWGTGWGPYGGYAYIGYDQCNIGKYIYWVYPKQ